MPFATPTRNSPTRKSPMRKSSTRKSPTRKSSTKNRPSVAERAARENLQYGRKPTNRILYLLGLTKRNLQFNK